MAASRKTASKKTAAKKNAAKKASSRKGVGGRPSLYREEHAEQARKLCLLGAKDAELADFFGVTEQTINGWKKSRKAFFDALNGGKLEADAKVANSLYQRALGYSHPDVHISNYQGEITVTPITKYYPPDTTAAIFWLKNRRRSDWRDKQDVSVTSDPIAELLGAIDGKTKGLPDGGE